MIKLESASKQTTQVVCSHSGTPFTVGTSHGHFEPQDSPRPELGGSHHLPPYIILCDAPLRLHPNGYFSRDSQVGVPKLSRNGPGWSLGTLGAHNSRLQSLIATRLVALVEIFSTTYCTLNSEVEKRSTPDF
jgi:hypothetical protein